MARILIAEDEPDIRELVAFTLRFAGHEVNTASNGEEAFIRHCRSFLISSDGCSHAENDRLRRLPCHEKGAFHQGDIPVVFLSAKGQDSEIQTGLEAGAEEYLLKPFAPDQLVERVKSILSKFGK
jgi:DNA-binding response OmpR family regulator